MKLSFKDGKKNKIHISVDDEYALTVDRDYFLSLGIKNNSEISAQELNELTSKINIRRAFNKAVDLLSRRDHSEKELMTKLKQKGFEQGSQEAIDKLRDYGYIDDRRFALGFLNQATQMKSWGKMRVKQELRQRGVDRDIISEILEDFEFNEDELTQLILRKYSKNLSDEKGKKRTFNALVRLGYSYSEIKTAMANAQDEDYCMSDFDVY